MLYMARSRYDECRNHHASSCVAVQDVVAPKRVLLVAGCRTSRHIKLALPSDTSYKAAPYACLSYCWGERQRLMLTRDVLDAFLRDGLYLDDLPATIREACELCDGIGIPYLFVDSLCILQDSARDWEEALQQMGDEYSRAALTIAAASSRDCRDGLLGNRRWQSHQTAELRCRDDHGRQGTCYIRGRFAPDIEPLDDRGWALQEDLLSPRLLRIGTSEISFHCAGSTLCESEAAVAVPSRQIAWNGPLHRPTSITVPPGENLSTNLWRAFVWNYARRRLSYEKDKLPAIAGIAVWLCIVAQPMIYSGYLDGIWATRLPTDLLWFHDLPFPIDDYDVRIPAEARAPSWSWARYDCPYLEWVDCTGSSEYTRLSYLGTAPELAFQGPLKRGWLVPNGTHHESFDFWEDGWESDTTHHLSWAVSNCLGRARLDVIKPLAGRAESFAQLMRARSRPCDCLRITDSAGLLVQRIEQENKDDDRQYHCRLGLVQFKADRSEQWWADAATATIRLL